VPEHDPGVAGRERSVFQVSPSAVVKVTSVGSVKLTVVAVVAVAVAGSMAASISPQAAATTNRAGISADSLFTVPLRQVRGGRLPTG